MIQASDVVRGPGSALRVEVVDDARAWVRLQKEWDALFAGSDAPLFAAWEWLEPWHRRIAKRCPPHLLIARDGRGALVGLLPLCRDDLRDGARTLRRLVLMGASHTGGGRVDLLASGGEHARVAESFAAHLCRTHGAWDLLELDGVDASSPTLDVFRRVFDRQPFRLRFDHRGASVVATLGPMERFEDLLRLGRAPALYLHHRRRLRAQPGFTVERAEEGRGLAAALEEHLRLGGLRAPDLLAFHRHALVRLAGRRRVRLYTLRIGGEAVASIYGLVQRDTFLVWQAVEAAGWRGRGGGWVLIDEAFADARASGFARIELMAVPEQAFVDGAPRRFRLRLRIWPAEGAAASLIRREDVRRALRIRLGGRAG
ncbi:MAG: GNAT family N-acetyltransferase [Myxococcaceae bacterium]|nr:GNAT family N-acetyltransferase [Myxococcaceae bacterium]